MFDDVNEDFERPAKQRGWNGHLPLRFRDMAYRLRLPRGQGKNKDMREIPVGQGATLARPADGV